MLNKFLGVLKSRRFYVALGGAVVILLHDVIGMDEQTAQNLVNLAIAWIVGDSITKTDVWK